MHISLFSTLARLVTKDQPSNLKEDIDYYSSNLNRANWRGVFADSSTIFCSGIELISWWQL
jgi:hypothetical protein